MKLFLIVFLCSFSLVGQTLTVEGQSDSLYKTIVDEFEKPVVGLLSFEELYGNYVGRCFTFKSQDAAMGALLIVSKKNVSDNGPMFPPSYEWKAMNFYGYNDDFNDDMTFIPRNFKYTAAVNWDVHSELQPLGASWYFTEDSEDSITYLKNTEKGLMSVTYMNDNSTGNLLDEDLELFKVNSYKRILRSCYFFKKFQGEDIVDSEELRP